jgi:hypothetical protein
VQGGSCCEPMVRSTCSRHHRAYSTMKFVKPLRQSASPRIPIAALRPKPKASRDAFRVYVVCSWVGCFAVWAVDMSGKAPCCLARRRNHTASNLWTRHLANRAPRIHESSERCELAIRIEQQYYLSSLQYCSGISSFLALYLGITI